MKIDGFVYRRGGTRRCLSCKGTGRTQEKACPACTGRGRLRRPKRWYLCYQGPDGKIVRESVGTLATRELAEAKLRMRVEQVALRRIKFADFVRKHYLPHVEIENRPQTVDWKRRVLGLLLARFGDREIADIRREEVEQLKTDRAQAWSPTTANRTLAVLSHCFSRAVELGFAAMNVAKLVKRFREPESPLRFLEEADWQRLLEAAPEWFRPLIAFSAATGLRRGEILSLRWGNVDLARRLVVIPAEIAKSRKARSVPLSEGAMEALWKLPRTLAHDFVFVAGDGTSKLTIKPFRKAWEGTVRRSGVRMRFHDLRSQFASLLVQRGASLEAIRQLLGHSDLRMVLKYAKLSPSNLREAVSLLDGGGESGTAHAPTHAPREKASSAAG